MGLRSQAMQFRPYALPGCCQAAVSFDLPNGPSRTMIKRVIGAVALHHHPIGPGRQNCGRNGNYPIGPVSSIAPPLCVVNQDVRQIACAISVELDVERCTTRTEFMPMASTSVIVQVSPPGPRNRRPYSRRRTVIGVKVRLEGSAGAVIVLTV